MTARLTIIRSRRFAAIIGLALVAGSGFAAPASSEEKAADEPQAVNDQVHSATSAEASPEQKAYESEIEAYCANIADAARDQRYLRQKNELDNLKSKVDERIALLEQRRDEYQKWLGKRDDFMRVAEATLVDIYKNMRPDAAASQLSLINPGVAAAIVMKLNARLSSQILNEMEPEKAAALAGIIANAAATEQPKDPS
ncbi:MAG: flagellar protein [Rhizobiales bacterium]|nr:flagellar protein [Hyphomicrobiales bacterium]MBA67574.1 flagellar protein [Hyphomicrobiales bacterium]|tara:strand:+ start:3544 stop:4137 length:594 start_codon:yes stop_codon:yes gene_type:complete